MLSLVEIPIQNSVLPIYKPPWLRATMCTPSAGGVGAVSESIEKIELSINW